MSRSNRWSKRFDVKVVPRRYLHLYRCFGWTPTSPVATPQYDWERQGPNSAAAYTSADISLNLHDYDDLGMKRKELIAIQRNTKFWQYKKQYPGFFKDEKRFNKLMEKYTVGKRTKLVGLKQMYYICQKAIDFILCLFCLALFAAAVVPQLAEMVLPYVTDSALYTSIAFFVLGAFFLFLSTREITFGKIKTLLFAQGSDEDFTLRKDRSLRIKGIRCWFMLIPALFCVYMGLLSFDILPKEVSGFFTTEQTIKILKIMIATYGLCGVLIHFRAFRNVNPYAWIKLLCLRARPTTKRILLSDVSMMSPQQRQRYGQGRIISSAVNDALDKHDRGIREDFFIGY